MEMTSDHNSIVPKFRTGGAEGLKTQKMFLKPIDGESKVAYAKISLVGQLGGGGRYDWFSPFLTCF